MIYRNDMSKNIKSIIFLLLLALSTGVFAGKGGKRQAKREQKSAAKTSAVVAESTEWLQPEQNINWCPPAMASGVHKHRVLLRELRNFPRERPLSPADAGCCTLNSHYFKMMDDWPVSYMMTDGSYGIIQKREFTLSDWHRVLDAYAIEADALIADYASEIDDVVFVGIGRSPSFMLSLLDKMGYPTWQIPYSRHNNLVESPEGKVAVKAYLSEHLNTIASEFPDRKIVLVDAICSGRSIGHFLHAAVPILEQDSLKYIKIIGIDVWGLDVYPWLEGRTRREKYFSTLNAVYKFVNLKRLRDISENEILNRVLLFDEINWPKSKSKFPGSFDTIMAEYRRTGTIKSIEPSGDHLRLLEKYPIKPEIFAPATQKTGGAGNAEGYFSEGSVGGGGGADGDAEEVSDELPVDAPMLLWDAKKDKVGSGDSTQILGDIKNYVQQNLSLVYMAIVAGLLAPNDALSILKM